MEAMPIFHYPVFLLALHNISAAPAGEVSDTQALIALDPAGFAMSQSGAYRPW